MDTKKKKINNLRSICDDKLKDQQNNCEQIVISFQSIAPNKFVWVLEQPRELASFSSITIGVIISNSSSKLNEQSIGKKKMISKRNLSWS